MVAGRLGYNTQSQDTGGLHGLSMGLGLMYTDYAMNYSLDYAFVPYGELGNTHRISFGIKF
jgi:hemolysin activation/secretion protein